MERSFNLFEHSKEWEEKCQLRFKGFIGPSYTLSSVNFDCQRCINLYPEVDEVATGKDQEVASLIGTPGLSLLQTLGSGPIRGMWYTSTGQFYVVSGSSLYVVDSSWNATNIGTLQTTSGQVSMADNGLQLVIVDGPNGYYVTLTGATLVQFTSPNWMGSNLVTYQDGYFIFATPDSKQHYLSDLNDVTFTAPAYSNKEGNPDKLVSHISVNRNLWLFGDQTTEVWYDSGDALNPFQYIQGTLSQYGCAAKFGVAKHANTVFWLGKDSSGRGVVFMATGYTPQRISTHAVELAIQGYSDISDAIAFSYQENGHHFFVLTFPTGNATWVYDGATGLWHERAYTNQGVLQRHRANCHAYAFNKHVVGDYSTGAIYSMSSSVYSDNGSPITRQRVTPHLSQDMQRLFFSSLELDIESGTGLDGIAQGTDPQAMLKFSDDGGHTWSNEKWTSFGKIGATKQRAIWRRLGQSRNRVFSVTITDPVKVVLMGAEIDVMAGAS